MDTKKCTFRHICENAVESISSLLGNSVKYNKNKNELVYSCSTSKLDQVRSAFANSSAQYPQIWLSIPPTCKPGDGFFRFGQNISDKIDISFGCLLSTSKFFIHETPLKIWSRCTAVFQDEQTFVVNCSIDEKTNDYICFTFPMKFVDKTVLIKENETFLDIIFNIQTLTSDVRKNDNKHRNERLYGNDELIESLSRCSDIVLRISSKSDADKFLNYLCITHKCQIFYTNLSIEEYKNKLWDKIEYNWYSNDEAIYGLSMLRSLGYIFDDKYLTNNALQSTMVILAETDEKQFYQLTVEAYYELKRQRWLDLTTIFNEKRFEQVQIKMNDYMYYVGVICLTPTCFYLEPKKQEKRGHRAMRFESFRGANNFCLVKLISDPSDNYLTNDPKALEYFRKMFVDGFEIGRDRFHLFGSSNSQIKEHSYWFNKAQTLDEIHKKRLELGQFDRIDNLGTYASRLGLWFSSSSPTGIKLVYCNNLKEFNKRVQQKEICVIQIDDIERNGYCFTDGNGFISKGLAKRVAEKLSLCWKTSPDLFPSAYQIRLAGCKGLLVVDPQSTLEQFYVKIRKSMCKFECVHWELDICETSRAMPTCLNNQIILLLSDLGVPDETFLRLQNEWFQRKPSIKTYFDSENLLKNKIPLANNKCRFMYGCAFESRLKPGECFIRYEVLSENRKPLVNRQFQCVQGQVIVTKNPCPYAGDLLRLTAVDLPDLHCLSDVIVFSTEDTRPDCNKIAGSDLDGDQYFVYWGEDFILQGFVDPLEYKPDKKVEHQTPITPIDVIDYYLSTIGATSYGEIYNLHAVVVDKNEENYHQRTCQPTAIELARMFSSAIDSGKTGYIINKNRVQQLREKYGEKYPDFLKKKYGKESYVSQSIIGKLYRNAVAYRSGNFDQLNNQFSRLNIRENQLENTPRAALNSLPVNTSTQLTNSEAKPRTSRPYSGKKSLK